MNKKIVSVVELTLIVISAVAFAYFLSTDLPEIFVKENSVVKYLASSSFSFVSATDGLEKGCCKETKNGATCQDVLLVDKEVCKTDLIGVGCSVLSECQKGCCYDADSGMCSLNAPKESCTSYGGIWDSSSTCNIIQCQLGCCLLGDGAAMTTTRECTKLSGEYKLEKIFKPLDSQGTCNIYTELLDVGACLTEANDYSGEKNCVFTTKSNCNRANQEFKKDYLCTSKELNTNCVKTTKTTCIDDKVYFIDSCGNKANVYDSFKGKNQTYWEKAILPENSCEGPAEFCGNCQYTAGSVCSKYSSAKEMPKPDIGDYVCKNLDCVGGRKHGESWCVSDAINDKPGSQAVGTRNYVASCFEGEIILEGCADFNQEICIENSNTGSKKSEAMCTVNDWRSCIYANDQDSYSTVKSKCDSLPQCVMFNEISGNEKYKELPGFLNMENSKQGAAGKIGQDSNKYVMHCVPKFVPGYQFWNSVTPSNPFTSGSRQESSVSYGGSEGETKALCDLGTFICVSHIETTSSMAGGSSSIDKENPECNIQAVDQEKQQVSLMMEALNERCRMLGSCGMQYNTQEVAGRSGFSVNRIYIDKKGKSHTGYTTQGYNLTAAYLSMLKKEQKGNSFGTLADLKSLTSKTKGSSSMLTDFGSEFGTTSSMLSGAFKDNVQAGTMSNDLTMIVGGVGALSGIGMATTAPAKGAAAGAGYSAFAMVAFAAAVFTLGSLIGSMLSKGKPPGQAKVETAMWAGGVTAAAMATMAGVAVGIQMVGTAAVAATATTTAVAAVEGVGFASAMMGGGGVGGFFTTVCFIPILCVAIAIAAVAYMLFTQGTDHEYYITEFKCEAWQPPLVGKCEECNNDVRPCTEYKCRSLGNNCKYFTENGEPGYCATMNDIWNAKIKPWKETISEGNSYENISDAGFRIENKKNPNRAVNSWEPVTFGIITDKEAICKIDNDRSRGFEDMRFLMIPTLDEKTGKLDGKNHKIVLSPHTIIGEFDTDMKSTAPMSEGENEYYIICQNFAGAVNDAPFVVQVRQAEGPDWTPPVVLRTFPENNAYLANGADNLTLFVYLNEPAECRYSFESYNFDQNTNETTGGKDSVTSMRGDDDNGIVSTDDYESIINRVPQFNEEILNSMNCVTNPGMGFSGEWMCTTPIFNYTPNKKIYIECKDQPGLLEEGLQKRNKVRTELSFPICDVGLSIDYISPVGNIEIRENSSVELSVMTSGCIKEGEAICSYRFPYYGDTYSLFFKTGAKTHSQPLDSLGRGNRTVEVFCEDSAGNVARAETNFTIFLDDDPPLITRVYKESGRLMLSTNEKAECLFSHTEDVGCEFNFTDAKGTYSSTHSLDITENSGEIYYIRCRDEKGNAPVGCSVEIKLKDIE